MKLIFLSFLIFPFAIWCQDYEDVDIDSEDENDTIKNVSYLNQDINFSVGIGPSYSQIGKGAYLGPKMHFKFMLGKTKRHRLGLDANVMFGLNSIEGDTMTYKDGFDTITQRVGYKFLLVNWNLAYDYYIFAPKLGGLGWRVGVSGGIDIQNVDYNPGPFISPVNTLIGYRVDFVTGLEYRWHNNFGIYGEISAGYHEFNSNIPAIRQFGNFVFAATVGISYEFRLIFFSRNLR
ncbi:MAG: hypothetical protein R2799_11460 [Crocinitomicaceae bacterium]